jgi:hypothetical protein
METEDRIMSKGDAVATVLTIAGYFGLRHLARKERRQRNAAIIRCALTQIAQDQDRLLKQLHNGEFDGDFATFLRLWNAEERRRRNVIRWL